MSAGTNKRSAFLAPLEGMRGIAAVGVVLYHTWYHWHINALPLIEHGNLFVDLFFVISGFVISHVYITRLQTVEDLAQFAVLRTARLYPLHLFTLLWLAAYALVCGWAQAAWHWHFPRMHADLLSHNTWPYFIENLFMGQGLQGSNTPSFNSPSWSISTEYFTYFIFALAAVIALPRSKQLPVAFASLTAAALAYMLWGGSLTDVARLPRCIGGFFAGTLVYLAWTRMHAAVGGWLGRGWRAHAAECAGVAAAAVALWFCGDGYLQFLLLPCFALLVFLLADGKGVVTLALQHRYIQKLGKWSYSIYMVHFSIILLFSDLARLWWRRGPSEFMWWDMWRSSLLTLLLLTTVLLVASQTYRLVEDPPRRWAKRWAAKRWGKRPETLPDAPIGAP